MSEQRLDINQLINVPHFDTAVERAAEELVRSLAEHNARDGVTMTLKGIDELTSFRRPYFDRPVLTSSCLF